jgi:hypothetical protein
VNVAAHRHGARSAPLERAGGLIGAASSGRSAALHCRAHAPGHPLVAAAHRLRTPAARAARYGLACHLQARLQLRHLALLDGNPAVNCILAPAATAAAARGAPTAAGAGCR